MISKYEEFVKTSDLSNHGLQFYLDGMTEEHGELVGIFKRVRRGDYGGEAKKLIETYGLKYIIDSYPEVSDAVQKELGDYQWYYTRLVQECGWNRELIDKVNLEKLTKRVKTGTLMGRGDNREDGKK